MALEDIQKKIIADAENTKEKLLQDAESQKIQILEEAQKVAYEYSEEYQKQAIVSAENLERGLVIDARRKLANEILTKKRKKIEQIFQKSREKFITSVDYPEVMISLISKNSQSKKEQIILSQDEKILDQKWLDDLNKKSGGSFTFSSEKGNFFGGVMLSDSNVLINITIDTLFSLLREQAEKPIAEILFGR